MQILFIKHWHIDQKGCCLERVVNKTKKQAVLGVKNSTFQKEPSATITTLTSRRATLGGYGPQNDNMW